MQYKKWGMGEPLTSSEFSAAFKRLWHDLEERFFKFERLQAYQEPDDPSFRAFLQGDLEEAEQLLKHRILDQAQSYTKIIQNNVAAVRVRAIERPFTDYLLYECLSYPISAQLGERIVMADFGELDVDDDRFQTSDFLLFDNRSVLVHDYGDDGIFKGGWIIENEDVVAKYSAIATSLISISIPFAVFREEDLT